MADKPRKVVRYDGTIADNVRSIVRSLATNNSGMLGKDVRALKGRPQAIDASLHDRQHTDKVNE